MLEFVKGNMFESDAEAIVNTVNCVGVMGKGVALEVKKRYPSVFSEYKEACNKKLVKPGHLLTLSTYNMFNPKLVINFPTKRHWKANSRIEDVEAGLESLVREIKILGIQSIAIPPLGCGNGGLNWNDVKPRIASALKDLPNVDIKVYEPSTTSNVVSNKQNISPKRDFRETVSKPRLTKERKLLLELIHLYTQSTYVISLLEIQNLAYFLQDLGQSLKLNFQMSENGPYDEKLNLVLRKLNGFYLEGDFDNNRNENIRIRYSELEKDSKDLKLDEKSLSKVEKVIKLTQGYRSPYGMELLATSNWILNQFPSDLVDNDVVLAKVTLQERTNKRSYSKADILDTINHIRNIK